MLDIRTEEQALLVSSMARLTQGPLVESARAWDAEERFCHEAVEPLQALGLWGASIPAAYGGAALSTYSFALLIASLARLDGSLALTVQSHCGLCCAHLLAAGTEAQKQKYLPKLAEGTSLGAWGLTEPGSGSDAAAMQTTATYKNGAWHLSGSKIFITQGTVADVYVILAVTDRDKKQGGITAFLLEKDTPGFSFVPLKGKHGMRGSDTATLYFDDVVLGDAQRLGEVNEGFKSAMRVLDKGRIAIAALALGLAEAALDAARTYASMRKQFGQPLDSFQATQFRLADMATDIEASRLLVQNAAYFCDTGQSFGKQASMAKLFASEAAIRVCQGSLQIHGGYGYTNDFVVERHLRDARLCTIGEGTSEIQRMVIARHLRREREA